MGRRRQIWVDKVLQNGGTDMWETAERMIPSSTVTGKGGSVCTLPMSDRKRQLVKKWVTTDKGARRW